MPTWLTIELALIAVILPLAGTLIGVQSRTQSRLTRLESWRESLLRTLEEQNRLHERAIDSVEQEHREIRGLLLEVKEVLDRVLRPAPHFDWVELELDSRRCFLWGYSPRPPFGSARIVARVAS